jgi:hypothetical protein
MIDLWPVQQALYGALTAAPATYPVYDAVPQGTAFPYLVLGEITSIPDDELEAASADASFTVHAWSRNAGKKQIHAMLEFARARLDNEPLGGGAWACSEDFAEVMEDRTSTAASRLYHGVARYRVRVN